MIKLGYVLLRQVQPEPGSGLIPDSRDVYAGRVGLVRRFPLTSISCFGRRRFHVAVFSVCVLLFTSAPDRVTAGPAYLATHRLTSAEYQAWVNHVVRDGFRIVYVNGYDAGGAGGHAAVAITGGSNVLW